MKYLNVYLTLVYTMLYSYTMALLNLISVAYNLFAPDFEFEKGIEISCTFS